MSNQPPVSATCEAFRIDLAETALGVVSGRRRAEVLGHVASCATCSAELEEFMVAADALMHFAPESDPPVGFELRLANRLRSEASRRSSSGWRRAGALVAAAAVTAALGVGVGAWATSGTNPGGVQAMTNITSANLSSRGHVLGEFLVSAGKPAWMYMTVDSGKWTGVVTCQVVLASGKIENVGQFTLEGGYGAWGAPLMTSAAQVRGARLISADGTVYASARIPA